MALAATLITAGCTIPTGTAESAAAVTPAAAPATEPLIGKVVFLDPGHNGANDDTIDTQVPTGRGGSKNCQTTGTNTDAGFAEHTFNWEVTSLVKSELEAEGATVLLSRPDDTSVGSCVDARAEAANASGADIVVSIHADGADGADASAEGFHVCYSAPPLNPVQAGPSVTLAETMRDSLTGAGLTPSTYIGENGLSPRADLTGLNLAQRPSILVELGNMRNADEAARMSSPAGQAEYASAISDGVQAFLTSQ
ncbi:Rv3717 family N-acetylmuramoyl-L-alanine amidase [Rhodococcus globerulus]|uniref:Rv3717 family N-acetylmuramoyl-L-alanine amidase n=1 Tax=Rhodococcus globerulus TaxID=33008 RepID=A0ABU4C0T3_RHOGO|nr:Rv3717 family N-acetylmuramoyl-L-alanine amidase [Rhodococcus globerulus]